MQSIIFESENEYKLPCFVPYIYIYYAFEERNFFLLLSPKQAYPLASGLIIQFYFK